MLLLCRFEFGERGGECEGVDGDQRVFDAVACGFEAGVSGFDAGFDAVVFALLNVGELLFRGRWRSALVGNA